MFDPPGKIERPRAYIGTQLDKGLPHLIAPAFGTRLYDVELGTIERWVGTHWEVIGGEQGPPGAPIGELLQGRVLNNVLAALGRGDTPGGGGGSVSPAPGGSQFTTIINTPPSPGGSCNLSVFSTDTATINALATHDLGFGLDIDNSNGKFAANAMGLGIDVLETGIYLFTAFCFFQTISGDVFTSHGGVLIENVETVCLNQSAIPGIDAGNVSVSAQVQAASIFPATAGDTITMRAVNRDHSKRIQVKPAPAVVSGFAGVTAYMFVACL